MLVLWILFLLWVLAGHPQAVWDGSSSYCPLLSCLCARKNISSSWLAFLLVFFSCFHMTSLFLDLSHSIIINRANSRQLQPIFSYAPFILRGSGININNIITVQSIYGWSSKSHWGLPSGSREGGSQGHPCYKEAAPSAPSYWKEILQCQSLWSCCFLLKYPPAVGPWQPLSVLSAVHVKLDRSGHH